MIRITYKKAYRSTNRVINHNFDLSSYMANATNSGCTVRLDGTLKDASEIEWHYDEDDNLLLLNRHVETFNKGAN